MKMLTISLKIPSNSVAMSSIAGMRQRLTILKIVGLFGAMPISRGWLKDTGCHIDT